MHVESTAPHSVAFFDIERLELLRDKHRELLDQYRKAGERYRQATEETARARGSLSTDPRAQQVMRLSGRELSKVSLQQLADAQIDPRAVQRLVMLEGRAERLRADRDALEGRTARSIAFMERVEAYARKNNL